MEKDQSSDSPAAPTGSPPPPTLAYQSLDSEVLQPRPRRRTVPRPFGIAFFVTSPLLTAFWLYVDLWNVFLPHVAVYVVAVVVMVGFTMFASMPLRLAAAGVLMAVALWILLLGTCYGIGGVRPLVF